MPGQNIKSMLQEQSKTKPNIEDVIPYYLDGDNKKITLEFIAYLRENKMKPVWAIQNGWKATYKGKVIYYIRLPNYKHHFLNKKQSDQTDWMRSWVVTPYILHYNKYTDLIINEGLQSFIWESMRYCINVLTGECNSHKCAPGINISVLGREFKNLCHFVRSGANTVWFVNPDETAIDRIKKLLDFEKQAREFANKKVMELSCPSNCQIDHLQDENRTGVLKITNPDNWAVVNYDLSKYKDQNITINFKVDIKRVGAAGTLMWQVNNEDYPSVGIPINNATADIWHTMSGEWTGIPTAAFPTIFLSTYENNSENTTYYIDNFTITITPTV